MKPDFALSLSFEGIALLHRAAGGWRSVGEVSLEAADLARELAALRTRALELEPDGLRCKIILPNEQIRYLSLDAGSSGADMRQEMVRRALDGATPYAVDDLAFDISVENHTIHVAAVARETLAEAETFAVEHDFNPISFVARPGDNPFLGEPFFGATGHADTLPGATPVEPDGIAVVIIGPAQFPEPKPDPEPVAAPGFASRRGKPQGADTPPAEPVQTPPETPAPDADDPVPPPPVSVTAPELDIPAAAPVTPQTHETTGGFLSRRKPRQTPAVARPLAPPPADETVSVLPPAPQVDPDPVAEPVPEPAPEPVVANVAFATTEPPGDETARMTVFGARQTGPARGRTRPVGFIMLAALLLFLAAAALWATLFLDNDLARLIFLNPDETELAAEPEPPVSPDLADDQAGPATRGGDVALASPAAPPVQPPEPSLSTTRQPDPLTASPDRPQTSSPPGLIATQPQTPGLSDTDAAVLDALRQPQEQLPEQTPQQPPQAAVPATAAPGRLNPAEAEDQARYAATGIWQRAPQVPQTPSIISLDDLYVASIDRTDLSYDAVALAPVPELTTDLAPEPVTSPVAAGTDFAMDTRGQVIPTVEGTLSPDGIVVYLGRPKAVPPRTPTRSEIRPETDAERARLAAFRPKLRPSDLVENAERSQLGGLTRSELGGLRPKLRPGTAKQLAEKDQTPTKLAVAASRKPNARPQGFDEIVRSAQRNAADARARQVAAVAPSSAASGLVAPRPATPASVAPASVAPRIPSSASVARQATLENAINLRRVNLIGVYGTPSNRRALVRLSNGRYKKVQVGDTVDGGRVVAIGESELRYQKRGRNLTLKIPSG